MNYNLSKAVAVQKAQLRSVSIFAKTTCVSILTLYMKCVVSLYTRKFVVFPPYWLSRTLEVPILSCLSYRNESLFLDMNMKCSGIKLSLKWITVMRLKFKRLLDSDNRYKSIFCLDPAHKLAWHAKLLKNYICFPLLGWMLFLDVIPNVSVIDLRMFFLAYHSGHSRIIFLSFNSVSCKKIWKLEMLLLWSFHLIVWGQSNMYFALSYRAK